MEFSVTPTYKPGVYRAKLVNVEMGRRNNFETGAEEDCREWTFELVEPGFEGGQLKGRTSMAFGPNSNTRKWVEALLGGRKMQTGDKTTAEALKGSEVDLSVESTDSGYSKIVAVHPAREKGRTEEQSEFEAARHAIAGTKQPVGVAADADAANEDEWGEIPF